MSYKQIIRDLQNRTTRRFGHINLNPNTKFEAYRRVSQAYELARRGVGLRPRLSSEMPLVPSNAAYGHEHWLRLYSGYTGDIKAVVEHGVYFGGTHAGFATPYQEEWQIGSFITFGQYRASILQTWFPYHVVLPVGPYISYVPTDDNYRDEIRCKKAGADARTLTLFPAHSLPRLSRNYDHSELAERAIKLAARYDCSNLAVCLGPNDYREDLSQLYEAYNFIVVSAGNDPLTFLPRQKAIFLESTVTVSNDLGTHIGYSLANGVPHVLVDQVGSVMTDSTLHDLDRKEHAIQRRDFFRAFSSSNDLTITPEQQKLFEYYWGIPKVFSQEEMKAWFVELDKHNAEFSSCRECWDLRLWNDRLRVE